MKKKLTTHHKFSPFRSLSFFLVILSIFLGISFYYAYTYASGPLSFLTETPLIATLIEDTGSGVVIKQTTVQAKYNTGATVIDTNTGAKVVIKNTSPTVDGKKDGTKLDLAISSVVKVKGNRASGFTTNVETSGTLDTDKCKLVGQTADCGSVKPFTFNLGSIPDSQQTGSTVVAPTCSGSSSCPGASSKIGGCQWAQTGSSMTRSATGGYVNDGSHACVQCGGARKDGKSGSGIWGDVAEQCGSGNAKNYITRPDQTEENKTIASCWKDGTWFADTAGEVGSEICINGDWKDKLKYQGDKNSECDKVNKGSTYDLGSHSCSTPTPPGGNAGGETDAQKAAREAAQKLADAKQACEEGKVNKFVGSSCISPTELGRRIRSCEETRGGLFDLKTGECGSSTDKTIIASNKQLAPSLKCGEQIMGGTNAYVDCGINFSAPKVIKFCRDGTFDKGGNCTLPLNSPTNPAISGGRTLTPQELARTKTYDTYADCSTKTGSLCKVDPNDPKKYVFISYVPETVNQPTTQTVAITTTTDLQEARKKSYTDRTECMTKTGDICVTDPNDPKKFVFISYVDPNASTKATERNNAFVDWWNKTFSTSKSTVNPSGKVGVHASSPAECKYGDLVVKDPSFGDWVCPTEEQGKNNKVAEITLVDNTSEPYVPKVSFWNKSSNTGKVCTKYEDFWGRAFSTDSCESYCPDGVGYNYQPRLGKTVCGGRDIGYEIETCKAAEKVGQASWDQKKLKCIYN